MALQKIIHLCVVSFFALVGVLNLLGGVGYVRRPWTAPQVKYYSGEMTVFWGILLLGVALGIFRHNSHVRILAIFLAAICVLTYGWGMVLAPGMEPVGWFLAWLFVLVWLLSGTTRMRFATGKAQAKSA
jgi:hypothetical protein